MIDYSPLWRSLRKRGITKKDLIEKYGFSASLVYTYLCKKDYYVNSRTLYELCDCLQLPPSQVFRFVFKDKNGKRTKLK